MPPHTPPVSAVTALAHPSMAKQVHIEAIQTVTPARPGEPGQSRPVAAPAPLPGALLRSRTRLVLYYRAAVGDVDSLIGWFKESLNAALAEDHLFAGRLRKRGGEGQGLEVRLNDAGVRLVQARAEVGLSEFLDMEGRAEKEGLLAYWAAVDEVNTHYSALLYVQVTSFQGEGYSVGLSCSTLLADPAGLTGFLKTWARVHTEMQKQNRFMKMPLFHLGNLKRPTHLAHLISTPLAVPSSPTTTTRTTILFEISAGESSPTTASDIADLCFRRAAPGAAGSSFYVIESGDGLEGAAVEYRAVKPAVDMSGSGGGGMNGGGIDVAVVGWDVLGAEKGALGDRNSPVHVSYRVECDDGLVIVMPRPTGGGGGRGRSGLVCVTVSKKVD